MENKVDTVEECTQCRDKPSMLKKAVIQADFYINGDNNPPVSLAMEEHLCPACIEELLEATKALPRQVEPRSRRPR